MKTRILTALVVVATTLGTFTVAEAKPTIELYFGVPYYSDRLGPDYRFYEGRGWYRDRDYAGRQITCQRARNILRNNGYRNIVTRDCNGRTYSFRATRNGRAAILYVNSRTGGVSRG